MFNSEKLGVGKPEDCSWQLTGFWRPASQVGWYEPADFFLPFFLPLLLPAQIHYRTRGRLKLFFYSVHKQSKHSVTLVQQEGRDMTTPPVGWGHCRSWKKLLRLCREKHR